MSVGGDETRSVGGARATSIGKDDALSVAKNLTITAGDSVSITTGDASIVIKKDGTITIKGKDITLEGSGAINASLEGYRDERFQDSAELREHERLGSNLKCFRQCGRCF